MDDVDERPAVETPAVALPLAAPPTAATGGTTGGMPHASAHNAAAVVVEMCRMSAVVSTDSNRNTHCSIGPWGSGCTPLPPTMLLRRLTVPLPPDDFGGVVPVSPSAAWWWWEWPSVLDVAAAATAASNTASSVGGSMDSITRDSCCVSYW